MIQLRPMRESEYTAYLDYFIPDYAAEISANYGLSEGAALEQAKREVADDLPDGVNTVGQTLQCLVEASASSETHVGYLWYKADTAKRSAFIFDFHILPAFQGKGFAKKALEALEDELKAADIRQIKLRVAGNNGRARHVYEAFGFGVTGINMSKAITPR